VVICSIIDVVFNSGEIPAGHEGKHPKTYVKNEGDNVTNGAHDKSGNLGEGPVGFQEEDHLLVGDQ
jgi:hypothetical protein